MNGEKINSGSDSGHSLAKTNRMQKVFGGYADRWRFRGFLLILLLILLCPVTSCAKNLTCNRLPVLMGSFLSDHYAMKNMTAEINHQAVDQMILSLDPSKTLFYASDVEWIRPVLTDLFNGMQSGNCSLLMPVYNLLVSRAKENEAIVKNMLGAGYQLDKNAELQINAKKRPYVRTKDEKQALLKKFVQFQIENALLAGGDLAEAKQKVLHRYALQTMRVVEQDPEKLIISAAEAFALSLDPHTSYLSPDNLEDLQIHMRLSLEGIGAVLSSDNGFTVIEELIPGGSAERSGRLEPRDKIIAVAQEGEKPVHVTDMDLRDVVKMIRGKKGTSVTLSILRQAERTYRFDITIKRDKISIKEQEAKITYQTRKAGGKSYRFGVIELPSFYGDEKGNKSCYEDVKKLLNEANRQRVDGIVLDLSRNGGGLLDEAVRLSGLFLDKGPVVAVKDGSDEVTIFTNGPSVSVREDNNRKAVRFPTEDRRFVYKGPLVVLTSRLSASASEIVAGALKDYKRAVIVGSDHTFGKGSVQTLIRLGEDLGGMKITTALYFLPGGKSTQKSGVAADVRLPLWFSLEDVGETALDYPLPAQEIASFLPNRDKSPGLWKPVEPALLSELAKRSKNRVAKNAQFAEIIKNNKEAAAKKDFIRIADLRKEMAKENSGKKNETPSELKKKAREQYEPFINESVNILLDMATMETNIAASAPRKAQAGMAVF